MTTTSQLCRLSFACGPHLFWTQLVMSEEMAIALNKEIREKGMAFFKHEIPILGVNLSKVQEAEVGGIEGWLNDLSQRFYGEELALDRPGGNALGVLLAKVRAVDQQAITANSPDRLQELGARWVFDRGGAHDTWMEQRWILPRPAMKEAQRLVRRAQFSLSRDGHLSVTGRVEPEKPMKKPSSLIQGALDDLSQQMIKKKLESHPWMTILKSGIGVAVAEQRELRVGTGSIFDETRRPRVRS